MSSKTVTADVPTSNLERRAIEQRQRIHETVSELRVQLQDTVREKLDVRRYASEYALPAAGTAAVFSLLIGYGTAGLLKRVFGGPPRRRFEAPVRVQKEVVVYPESEWKSRRAVVYPESDWRSRQVAYE